MIFLVGKSPQLEIIKDDPEIKTRTDEQAKQSKQVGQDRYHYQNLT